MLHQSPSGRAGRGKTLSNSRRVADVALCRSKHDPELFESVLVQSHGEIYTEKIPLGISSVRSWLGRGRMKRYPVVWDFPGCFPSTVEAQDTSEHAEVHANKPNRACQDSRSIDIAKILRQPKPDRVKLDVKLRIHSSTSAKTLYTRIDIRPYCGIHHQPSSFNVGLSLP